MAGKRKYSGALNKPILRSIGLWPVSDQLKAQWPVIRGLLVEHYNIPADHPMRWGRLAAHLAFDHWQEMKDLKKKKWDDVSHAHELVRLVDKQRARGFRVKEACRKAISAAKKEQQANRAAPLRNPRVVGLNMTIDDRCPQCGAMLALVGRTHRCYSPVVVQPLSRRSSSNVNSKQDQRASGSQHVSKSELMSSPSRKSGWTAERRAKHSAFMRELQHKKQEAAVAAQQEAAAQQAQQAQQETQQSAQQ